MKRVEYNGTPPEKCDLCTTPIANVFIDGIVKITKTQSGWANVCVYCHQNYGLGLGPGLGQEWWREGNSFFKIEG